MDTKGWPSSRVTSRGGKRPAARKEALPQSPDKVAILLREKLEWKPAELTRKLHDSLGGLLIAASAEAAWPQAGLPPYTGDACALLDSMRELVVPATGLRHRIKDILGSAAPDNVGLFAAIRWLLDHPCLNGGVACTGHYSLEEPQLDPQVAIALFRFVQETLQFIGCGCKPSGVTLFTFGEPATLTLHFTYYRDTAEDAAPEESTSALVSLRRRIDNLKGVFTSIKAAWGASTIRAVVPLG